MTSAKSSLKVLALLLCSSVFSPVMAAENDTWQDRVDVDVSATLQYITEDNTDLGTGSDRDDSFSQQLQVRTGIDFTDELYGFSNIRALNIFGESGFQDDDDSEVTAQGDTAFIELRELYLLKKDLFDVDPLSLQVGRQRVREPRALWWNSDNDLVRINYNTTLFNSFLAAGEDLFSYRNNTDEDFMEDDEDRFRVLGESSWQYRYNHFLEGRFVYEDDHSELEPIGSTVSVNDRDNEDANLLWAGVRSAGEFSNPHLNIDKIKYRADLIGLIGEEDQLTTVAGPGPDRRTVTGDTNRDVRAWAFDGGLTVDPLAKGGPVYSFGYAMGSGDDDPGSDTDNEFRQTDLQGSSSRVGLERAQQRNYGETLRPELSNIHILNAGIGVPLSDATDIGLTYFYYQLDEEATSLRSSGIAAPLNGDDKFLGQEVDIALNVDVNDQFNIEAPLVKDINFRVVAGTFFPGDAYEPADDDTAFRLFSELKLGF